MKRELAQANIDRRKGPDQTRFMLTLCFNLVPLAGVAFWGWSPFELIFLYWLENVVIGVRTLLAILLSGRFHGLLGVAVIGAFFTFHYGLFCAVHGVFVMTLFGGAQSANPLDAASIANIPAAGVLAILLWQSALLALYAAARDRATPLELIASPYPRIVVLHITILAGGFLLMALQWPHTGLVVLAIVKTGMDAAIALRGWPVPNDKTAAAVTRPPSRRRP